MYGNYLKVTTFWSIHVAVYFVVIEVTNKCVNVMKNYFVTYNTTGCVSK